MDKTQSPAQQTQMPLQISSEQLQQLQQHYQLQQAFANAASGGGSASIQVKQEFPNQQTNTITTEQLKQQLAEQQNQVQQMQLIETATASPSHR